MRPRADDVGLVWPYAGHVWLRRKAPVAAATLQEEAAVEGFTIKGLARPPKPPKKPPYEVGSYRWFKWVEERHMLEGAIEGAAEYRRRTGRGGGKLRH